MIFLIGWMVLGLIGEALFLYGMKQKYPDFEPFGRDMIILEIIASLLGGPVTFLALAVIFESFSDQDND